MLVYVTIDGELIETTKEHPFWVEGQGWTVAELLEVGDIVRLKDGSNLDIDKVEIVPLAENEYVKVYNFEVADWHTYFVSEFDVLVHNKCKVENMDDFGLGIGTPAISGGVYKSTSYVKDYTYLENGGMFIGGSGSLLGVDVGADINFSAATNEEGAITKLQPIGYTVNAGLALNSTVVGGGEGHVKGGVTETIWKWNFYDWYDENVYKKTMDW